MVSYKLYKKLNIKKIHRTKQKLYQRHSNKNIYTKTKLIDRINLENFNKLGLIQREDMWKYVNL